MGTAAGLDEGALSGAFVVRHRELIRRRYGAQTLGAAFDAMPPEQVLLVHEVTPLGWLPVSAMQALYDGLATVVGRSAESLHYEIGALASEDTIRSVWRIVLRMTSDAMLISRVPVLYPKTFNRGHLSAKLVGPGRAEASLDGWPDVPDYTLRGVRIAVEQTLRLSGRRDVTMSTERHTDGARFRVSWRA